MREFTLPEEFFLEDRRTKTRLREGDMIVVKQMGGNCTISFARGGHRLMRADKPHEDKLLVTEARIDPVLQHIKNLLPQFQLQLLDNRPSIKIITLSEVKAKSAG